MWTSSPGDRGPVRASDPTARAYPSVNAATISPALSTARRSSGRWVIARNIRSPLPPDPWNRPTASTSTPGWSSGSNSARMSAGESMSSGSPSVKKISILLGRSEPSKIRRASRRGRRK